MGTRHDPARRRRHRLLLPVVIVAFTTLGASGGVLWLAAHLLPHVHPGSEAEPPMADVVELVKFALTVGLSRWAQAV